MESESVIIYLAETKGQNRGVQRVQRELGRLQEKAHDTRTHSRGCREVRGPNVCEGNSREGARDTSPARERVGRCTHARGDREEGREM